jgi:predicted dithiol-disulfide oxidoreductase (DUF899 family)
MTTTPGNASSNLPGKPPVVDLSTWQAAREGLLVREKAHTREGDAIAAARRRLEHPWTRTLRSKRLDARLGHPGQRRQKKAA